MFKIDPTTVLTPELVKEYVERFETEQLPRLTQLDNYYNTKNKILERKFDDTSKPNNKVAHKFASYIVDTNTAIFLGAPVGYKSENDITALQDVLVDNDEHDINVDLATNAGIFGYGIQLLYIDVEAKIRMTVLSNLSTVLLYSDEIDGELLHAIRFARKDDKLTYTVYSQDKVWGLDVKENTNQFITTPVIVYKNNSRLKGDFEDVVTLIDEYDLLTSDTLNEQDYFNNCYLYLDEDSVDPDDIAKMKEARVIYGKGLNPKFILKEGTGTELENTKNRTIADLHKLSMTPDLSDKDFANNVSGVAMKFKLMGLLNNISNKERKFKKAINQRNKLIYSILSIKMIDEIKTVDTVFTRNIPQNTLELADVIVKLIPVASKETLLNLLPFIEDAVAEMDRKEKEDAIVSKYTSQLEGEEDE